MTAALHDRAIRLDELERITGLKRSAIYSSCAAGDFPKPIKIGKRASAWLESEVSLWLQKKADERGHA